MNRVGQTVESVEMAAGNNQYRNRYERRRRHLERAAKIAYVEYRSYLKLLERIRPAV